MFFVFLVNAMGLMIIVVSTLLESLRARLVKHGQCFSGHEFTEVYQAPPLRPTTRDHWRCSELAFGHYS